jgi:hypothetical protein
VRKLVIASALFLLASCKAEPPPVQQVQFVPPPPSKPTDRAPICGRPEEVEAFAAVGLQTQLMQTALSCGGEDKYGTFVTKFQSDLRDQRKVLALFFTRAYGSARSRSSFDAYITQLANAQSQHDLKSGASYCDFSKSQLDKALALATVEDLNKFAAQSPIQQSLDVEACGSPSAPPETVTVHRATRSYKKKKHTPKS